VKGVGKERSDGSHTQEDIHILITGDVGIAKSVSLKATAARTPRAKMVVGTKTSKVGLGAMAVKDELTNTWSLEIGALVLANGSTLCLDELDKMYPEHLSELLEPMSGSTVTINKAGISATLPASTSILASANPKMGNYDLNQSLAQQINLPTPILNRFDLIFILIDRPNEKFDSKAVEHIFKSYKEKMEPEVPLSLFKKYITYCRKLKPILDDSLVSDVQSFYVELRAKSKGNPDMKTIPVNLRNMEAVVKLAEAHAKLRLSDKVEVLDLNVAKEIFMFCVNQLVKDKETGMYDFSRMNERIPMSKRGKLDRFLELLHSLMGNIEEETKYGTIVEEAEKISISEWDTKIFLEELKKEIKIYEPRRGFYKLVEK
jgi:replicative DNA helicase Mcm